jgi:uncharacterized protein HemX
MNPQEANQSQPSLESEQASAPTPQTELNAKQPMPKASKPQGTAPIGIITFAVIVALALAGIALYLYKSGRQTIPTNQQSTAPATEQDVDNTSAAVEGAVSQPDDSQDFNDSDLSDANLGL